MSRVSGRYQLALLSNRNRYSFYILFLLGGFCALLYYFGEIVNLFGLEALRLGFFFGIHEIQRLLFLAPIIYAGYVFGARAAVITTIFTVGTLLPRALFISPFPDQILRPALFCIIAGVLGYVVAKAHSQSERHSRLVALFKSERDRLMSILEGMEDGVLITDPDYQVRFTNPSMVREFGEGIGFRCYKYLRGSDEPCTRNCKLSDVISGGTERWEYRFPEGRTYDVLASPYVASDGVVCQLAIFRKTLQNKSVSREV